LIFAITVTGIMANTMIAPAIPDILDDLGVAQSRAGLLLAAATLPGVVVAPVIGLLADRYGRREVLVPCLAVFGLAGGLSSFAPTFPALIGLRLLQGVGSAGLINLAVVVIADHWKDADRARVIGQNSAVLTVSLAVLPPLGGTLTDLPAGGPPSPRTGWGWSPPPSPPRSSAPHRTVTSGWACRSGRRSGTCARPESSPPWAAA